MKFKIFTILFISSILNASVVSSDPVFPTENDSIIIYFHADEGDQGLMGHNMDNVYAHIAVTTNKGVWQHLVADWQTTTAYSGGSRHKLSYISEDLYRLIIAYPREYFQISDPTEKIQTINFVFWNSANNNTGRDIGGADIFHALYEPGFSAEFLTPTIDMSFGDPARAPIFMDKGDSIKVLATAAAIGTSISYLELYLNDISLAGADSDSLHYTFYDTDLDQGMNHVMLIGEGSGGEKDSSHFYMALNPEKIYQSRPDDLKDGITVSGNSVTFSLRAPHKDFVYLIGDFNEWMIRDEYLMAVDSVAADEVYYWLSLDGLDNSSEYAFQYLVDGEIRIADPYSELVLDPWNDRYISASVYPGLKAYPANKTTEFCSVFSTDPQPFEWTAQDYERPAKEGMVIYEILLRDYFDEHDFSSLTDTLDYLKKLGVDVLELMPVNEFEGNESWGYNPAFYCAVDKYYGPPEDLKNLVNEAHSRNMAVVIDMVFNHSYGQSPLLRLYNEGNYGKPLPQNPWYNVNSNFQNPDAQWGYDFDHESRHTQYFIDRVNEFWMTEYKIDGFRFDFTKGFGNNIKSRSGDPWGSIYDPDRIRLLKRMTDQIWAVDSATYVILEHLAENREEKELADYGMLLWGNINHNYAEASMAWLDNSDLAWVYYETRGWNEPHLVSYMESHDEERILFKNLQYGNSSGAYNIQELSTALERQMLTAAFFLTIPGPKMIWQFGELGFDYSIDAFGGRLANKPPVWGYLQDERRLKLYQTYAALNHLRKKYAAFSTNGTVALNTEGAVKSIRISGDINAQIVGNFDVRDHQTELTFLHGGNWYDYFTGEEIYINSSLNLQLKAGEFRLYTDKYVENSFAGLWTSLGGGNNDLSSRGFLLSPAYPNPFNSTVAFTLFTAGTAPVTVKIFDLKGREVKTILRNAYVPGRYEMQWRGLDDHNKTLSSGMYFIKASSTEFSSTEKIILLK